jgi:ribose transport system permease protein
VTQAEPMIRVSDPPPSLLARRFSRHRGLLVACIVLAALLLIVANVGSTKLTYYDLAQMATSGATLAIAASGQAIVVLSGGFDLSAGAVVSLVNAVLASLPPTVATSPLMLALIGILIGVASGAFNGFFVAILRLQPIVVTLSTMFILQGITLLVLDKPGGIVAPELADLFLGDALPGIVPRPIVLLGILFALWRWLRRTRLGIAIYAVGSDFEAARASGVSTRLVLFFVYVIAGGCYGLAGVFISAQTGSGDPLVGNPMLLQMFTAVVVGGTALGGGRGGVLGAMIGAYILMLVVNILLVLNVSAYYSTVAEGVILILAVLGSSLSGDSELAHNLRYALTRAKARHAKLLPEQWLRARQPVVMPPSEKKTITPTNVPSVWQRHADTLRFVLPSYVCFALVIIATQLVLGHAILNWKYYNSLIVLSSFLTVLALGQGAVILTGGLDLSLPWSIALCGILFAGLVKGSDQAILYALPLVLLIGLAIGLVNGLGIVVLGVSPIVMTLAVNGILQGAALVYSNGTPDGFSSPLLRWFMTSQDWFVTPVVLFDVGFVIAASVLLSRTSLGRRIYGIGNGARAAALSGIPVGATLVKVYMLSGLCSAIVGALLTGFSGQASLGMGDEYLLPSIAVVVVGGTLITGGRGTYLGMLGGVFLLTTLQTLLAGTTVPYATRAIVFGLVVLGAVMALRDRRT